ncbi:putative hemolysin [Pasteurella testudinis DSM 23072]|uniref:Putative hemolysin n=1 Tax=Pasteurella testudinis DSM 23072 TaxID=1122938 RepID=A0A1W1V9A6_9PAST|nr:hemolysin family protein [Pasteurella testudinis]SMB90047.1 putative hemolysin [Pasteurella testudinis DSM 23072]SUB51320.1 cystathionine-beta-synthase CBS domain protein [Pasteurella testudinis]
MEVLILLGLILLNAIFAMSEIALVTARKKRLSKLAEQGNNAASTALKLGEDPTSFLSTIQIGITSIGILNGIVGEAVFAGSLSAWLQSFGLALKTANITATAVVVIVITYLSIVIGELVPKRLGQINPESIACLVAKPMQTLAALTRPFVMLLSLSTHALLKLIGVKETQPSSVTEEEIHALLEEGSEAGIIEQNQHEMVRNVFRLDDRKLGSLIIPRSEVVFIDIKNAAVDNLQLLITSEYSRFPVCDGGLDKILGVIHAKQALIYIANGQPIDYSANLSACIYVPETLTGMELLEQFRIQNMQMAFVIDEYGEVEGIITLQDILEAVTGEFTPNNEADAWAIQREDGSWLLDGTIPIPEMKDRLALKILPEEDKGLYYTLSGMIMLLLGRIPNTGDYVDWQGWRFEIIDMDEKRIDKILVSPLSLTQVLAFDPKDMPLPKE